MGQQIPNYSKHRPRKIIYINKAVYEETDGERSMLAIIGYGTAEFSYEKTPTLIEPITNTYIGDLEVKTTAPTSIADFGTASAWHYQSGDNDKLYVIADNWVTSDPIGKFEVPDNTNKKNVTFVGQVTTTPTSGSATTEYTNQDIVATPASFADNVYIIDLKQTVTGSDGSTISYNFSDTMALYVKANWNLGGAAEDGLTLINNNVADKLGSASDPETNPLAFAASIAVAAGSGRPFYVVAYDKSAVNTASTPAIAASSMAAVLDTPLRQLSQTDRVAYLVGLYSYENSNPVNKAAAVKMFSELENHVTEMSTEEEQKWRRAYIYTNTGDIAGASIKAYAKEVSSIVSNMSRTFENERIINVWADHAQYATINASTGEQELNDLDNMFVAVGIAALRAASQPHQGLSKTNLPWINNVKRSYTHFIPSELDEIASWGTFIVCQDDASDDVYIRHQLTTETDLGLMYWEDSIGTNVDNIAYGIKDVVEPYPGRYNIVNNALIEIEKSVADYLTSLTTTGISTEDTRLGPQLVRYENLKVWVHKQLRDRVVISVDLIVPVPMNVVEVHLNAYITTDFEAETV